MNIIKNLQNENEEKENKINLIENNFNNIQTEKENLLKEKNDINFHFNNQIQEYENKMKNGRSDESFRTSTVLFVFNFLL